MDRTYQSYYDEFYQMWTTGRADYGQPGTPGIALAQLLQQSSNWSRPTGGSIPQGEMDALRDAIAYWSGQGAPVTSTAAQLAATVEAQFSNPSPQSNAPALMATFNTPVGTMTPASAVADAYAAAQHANAPSAPWLPIAIGAGALGLLWAFS